MILTAKDIAEITRLLDDSHFSELRLEIGDFKLRISRGGAALRDDDSGSDDDAQPMPSAPELAPLPASAVAATAAANAGPQAGEVDVPAPLLGNFYYAPRPGDPPFVKPGDRITQDSVIGIIEVMKLMNSVRAGVAGIVVAHLAQDGCAVEEGQPLLRVKAEG